MTSTALCNFAKSDKIHRPTYAIILSQFPTFILLERVFIQRVDGMCPRNARFDIDSDWIEEEWEGRRWPSNKWCVPCSPGHPRPESSSLGNSTDIFNCATSITCSPTAPNKLYEATKKYKTSCRSGDNVNLFVRISNSYDKTELTNKKWSKAFWSFTELVLGILLAAGVRVS